MSKKGCSGPNEGQEQAEGEHVGGVASEELVGIEKGNGGCHHHTLATLQAIDTGVDVDSIGREDGQQRHVDVVENAWKVEMKQGMGKMS